MLAIVIGGPGCNESNAISLRFTRVANGNGDISGFQCREAGGAPIAQRGVERSRGAFTLQGAVVADMIRLEGLPHCRVADLVNWCGEHACVPIARERKCIDLGPVEVQLAAANDASMPSISDAIASAVASHDLSLDAPDEQILIRVVATAQPCTDLTDAGLEFDPEQLLGCAHSCPLTPDSTSGDVQLQLDTFTGICVEQVVACASTSFGLGMEAQ